MHLSIVRGRFIELFVVLLATALTLNAGAITVPASSWLLSLKWPSVWSMYELPYFPLQPVQNLQAAYLSSDFWELAHRLGDSVQQYTDDLLHNASISNTAAAGGLHDFKDTMTQMVINMNGLKAAVQEAAKSHGLNLENVSEMLSSEMAAVLEELKAEFPPPEEADHHRQRVEMVSRALMKIERCVVRVSMQCGMSEADASAHFRNIEPHIQHVIVVTGDLTEQHPILLETLLFSGAILLIPEVWILRPVLSIFGFGPSGPVKGTSAAWAQRRFWGASVAQGSWFARLQSAGMKFPIIPPGTGRKIIGSIGVGVGIVGSIFKSCA